MRSSIAQACPVQVALLDIPVVERSWRALDPNQRRLRTLDALKCLILRECQRQPVAVAFEDLHWADSETQAFLRVLVDSVASAPLPLVLTYRPEYEHPWASKSYYTQLRLNTLSPETTEEMLHDILGNDTSLMDLKQNFSGQGNPLLLEEGVRTLVETNFLEGKRGSYRLVRPLQGLHIPPTVRAVLAARIDRLSARDKRLLQVASVVGKDIPHAIMRAIAGLEEDDLRLGLTGLREAELLYETRLFPDLEFTFKHALTHEVAYAGILHERRRDLHSRIVEA